MFTNKRVLTAPLLAVVVVLVAAWTVSAQEAPPAPTPAPADTTPAATEATSEPAVEIGDKDLPELWKDMLHYVRLARPDIATSYGQAILKKAPKPADLYNLTIQNRDSLVTLDRGAKASEALKKVVAELRAKIEEGYKGERANPEMIARSIDALGGEMQAYQNAANRLVISGEFAMPQLVQKLAAKDTPAELKRRIQNVLVKIGKDAVNALSAALESNDPELQDQVANTLGKIGYRQSAPYLKELIGRKGVIDRVRKTAETALSAVVGREGAAKSVSVLAFEWAQNFDRGDESLQPDPRSSTAIVWFWRNDRLEPVNVPREIFLDIYAMRLAKMALQFDPGMKQAMSLWLAANIEREAELPAGAKDATLPEGTPSAKFFALASPPEILQDVLRRGLKEKNAHLAQAAIEALVKTQGAKSLLDPSAGRQPLVEALSYPDRSVRYLAAISLAKSLPDQKFTDSDVVVSVLNEALHLSGKKTALLVAADESQRNALKEALRAAGMDVNDQPDAGKALAAAKSVAGIDVIVVAGKAANDIVPTMRRDPALVGLLAIVVTQDEAFAAQFKGDASTTVIGAADKLADALAKSSKAAGEPLAGEQMNLWAIRAADAAKVLALTNNNVFDLNRLRPALIEALKSPAAEVQLAAAGALAQMSAAQAQQAVADLALKPELAEKTKVEALNTLTESIRKSGNQLSEAQVNALFSLVSAKGSQALREAAAQAFGALNLPSAKSRQLILGE